MSLLSKSAILGAADLKTEDVEVPAWGGTVRVRTMNGADRDEFRASLATTDEDGKVPAGKLVAALLIATCVDESGARLFTADDMAALQAKAAASLDGPGLVAMRLNGLATDAVSEALKNFASGQSDDSGSDLPKN